MQTPSRSRDERSESHAAGVHTDSMKAYSRHCASVVAFTYFNMPNVLDQKRTVYRGREVLLLEERLPLPMAMAMRRARPCMRLWRSCNVVATLSKVRLCRCVTTQRCTLSRSHMRFDTSRRKAIL